MLNRVAPLRRHRTPAFRRRVAISGCCLLTAALAMIAAPAAFAEGDDAQAEVREKLERVELRIAKTSEAVQSLEKALTTARRIGHEREVKRMSKMLDNMRQQLADLHDAQRELKQHAKAHSSKERREDPQASERDRLVREIESRRRAAAELERRIVEARRRQERDERRDARTRDRERDARAEVESKLARLERERAERRAKAAERLEAARRKLEDARRRADERRNEREHRDGHHEHEQHHERNHDDIRRVHEHMQKLEHHNRELQSRVEQMRHAIARLEQQVRRQDERIRRSEQASRESGSTLRRLSSWVKRQEIRNRHDGPHARDSRRSDERSSHTPRRGPSVEKQLLDRMGRVEGMLEKLIKIALKQHAKPGPSMGVVMPKRRLPPPPPPVAPKHVRIVKPKPDKPAPPAPVTYHVRGADGHVMELRGMEFRGVGPHLKAAPSVDTRPAPKTAKGTSHGAWLMRGKDSKATVQDLSTQLTKVVDRLAKVMKRLEKLEQRIAR